MYQGMVGSQEPDWHLGQKEEDHERVFPKYTNAHAASPNEVNVNGKVLNIWDFAQLESLSVPVLKQRVQAIKDVLTESQHPPMPSAQRNCLIQWILHMQADLTNTTIQAGRQGPGVPESFLKERKDRPITMERPLSPKGESVPFGPRSCHHLGMTATRDHFGDLKMQRNEFAQHRNEGIQSLRVGGEGRKYNNPGSHFKDGVADVAPQGIQSLKAGGEGRRYLAPEDHLMVDLRQDNPPVEQKGLIRTKMTEHNMVDLGTANPGQEPNVGGERKRHIQPPDHMMSHGVADTQPEKNEIEAGANHGRRYVDRFTGASGNHTGGNASHQSTWKQNPSRLMGTSLIC